MATLHVLSHSPFADSRLASCLRLLGADDALLLSGDAVYALQPGTANLQELGTADLQASLSGTVVMTSFELVAAATNSATLSGSAFSGASGNIGVNVSAGTGNQQANSLSMAVAQPSAAPPPPPPGG